MTIESDPDLEDVIIEERSRGRRPVDTKARRERQQLLRDLRQLVELGDERLFLEAIRALGLKDESPEFLNALRIWRDVQKL